MICITSDSIKSKYDIISNDMSTVYFMVCLQLENQAGMLKAEFDDTHYQLLSDTEELSDELWEVEFELLEVQR